MTYAGPCAGGPLNGQRLDGQCRTILIPIWTDRVVWDGPDEEHQLSQPLAGVYKFNSTVRMWIWSGTRTWVLE